MPQRLSSAALLALLVVLAAPGAGGAAGGAFREGAHGNPGTGVQRVAGLPRGECGHCHGTPRDAAGRRKDAAGHARLFAADANGLCLSCHARSSGGWLGARAYAQSSHGGSPLAAWPGPTPVARPAADAGKCLNCHDPHGVKDAAGLVPHLLKVRGAALCLGCHAGSPGQDVASALAKSFRHPLVAQAVPGTAPAADASRGGAAPQAGTCTGCHNPHASAAPGHVPASITAPALLGVRRVRLVNGAPGAPPLRTPVEEGDSSPVLEQEVCLACHGGTGGGVGRALESGPARSLDVATALNPANPSFHPVEAPGRNQGIDRRAFAPGWSAARQVACSDCHGSDDDPSRGPHGSGQPHLLRRRNLTRAPFQQLLETDLCFQCHAWRTYADPRGGAEQRFSRYAGHAVHAARGVSCWECHEPHGSALPALLARRTPGLLSWTRDEGGATCTVTCHQTTPTTLGYRVTYPR